MKATSCLKNHTPTRTLEDKTPFEMWYGERLDVLHLHELGCKVWVHIPGDKQRFTTDSWNASCWDTLTALRCIDAFTDKVAVYMFTKHHIC